MMINSAKLRTALNEFAKGDSAAAFAVAIIEPVLLRVEFDQHDKNFESRLKRSASHARNSVKKENRQ